MAFNPSSTIYLCNVPIDNTYQNQIYFSSKTEQQTYFSNRVQKTFSNYLTVRKTLPDGSLVSSVKVDCNIDDLYNCNYMYYQNANHGTRYFYAFITKLIYINEGTTEIRFETDVYQTWRFDVTLKESFVVREHSVTDNAGDNIVPEKFHFEDYAFDEVYPKEPFSKFPSKYGYLIGTSDFVAVEGDETEFRGSYQSGIYQGLYFYYFPDGQGVSSFIQTAERVSDCVQFICCIPSFIIENVEFTEGLEYGILHSTTKPAETYISFPVFGENNIYYDDYNPVNKKLYTSPYCNFIVTNNSGETAVYNLEDFVAFGNVAFIMYGDISTNPSITLVPWVYKGEMENLNQGISLKNFPQCSFNADTFKLWLAKNQFGTAIDIGTGIAQIIGGIGAVVGTGGIGSAVGAGVIGSGVATIANSINGIYEASKQPNSVKSGSPNNNLLTAMGRNTFQAYIRTIKKEYAKTLDDFFTMYGYATNELKTPNVSSRPYFNYVQTVDCNIVGAIPDDDMRQLKAMYNNGVTLWKSNATVGDYSVNNSPS